MHRMLVAGLAVAMAMAGSAAQAQGLPAGLKPAHVAGPGLYVSDLEAQKAWYMDKLGMSVVQTLSRDGKPFEYIMGFGDGAGAAILVLAKSAQRPAGPNGFSRVILAAPNARGLADWLKTQGVESREAVANVAYFVRDPEGNPIELYTAPKP